MSRFKVEQKVVCVANNMLMTDLPKLTIGATYTLDEYTFYDNKHYFTVLELQSPYKKWYYWDRYFEPIIESRSEFVEVTYTQIKETNPKVSAS